MRRWSSVSLAIVLVLLSSGGRAQRGRPQLVGRLAIVGSQPARAASELSLRATVRNDAHQTWLAPVFELSVAQLSVEVRDASGHVVRMTPPPVPPADIAREPLDSGRRRSFEIPLNVFDPPLPPGTYTLRWGRRQGISCAPVTFAIAPRP